MIDRLKEQFRLALPLIFIAVSLWLFGPMLAGHTVPLPSMAAIAPTLGDGLDAFVAGLQPLLTAVYGFVADESSVIALVAVVTTLAGLISVGIELYEVALARLQHRPRPDMPIPIVSGTGFWAGIIAVPLAAVALPGAATAVIAGAFGLTVVARAMLVRGRMSHK